MQLGIIGGAAMSGKLARDLRDRGYEAVVCDEDIGPPQAGQPATGRVDVVHSVEKLVQHLDDSQRIILIVVEPGTAIDAVVERIVNTAKDNDRLRALDYEDPCAGGPLPRRD